MTALEDKLQGSYIRISPRGIDLSNFQEFQTTFEERFFREKSAFGLLLEDEQGNHTELYGAFRPFQRRAQYTMPLEIPAALLDEGIQLTGNIMQYIEQFFHILHSIDPQREEVLTKTYEGEFRKVEITQRMPAKNWWRRMFIDVYSNSEELHTGIFSGMDKSSKSALKESDIWKRYEIVRKYIRSLQEEEPNFREQGKITEQDAERFLLRHSSYLRP